MGHKGVTLLLLLVLSLGKNGIFYLPHIIKLANSKFIFAIKGPKLARRGEEIQNLHNTIEGNFHIYLWMEQSFLALA